VLIIRSVCIPLLYLIVTGIERLLSCVDQIREEVTKKERKLHQTESSCLDDGPETASTDIDVTGKDGACAMGSSNLEDLARSLCSHIRNSNWLEINTAEKWTTENPELAKAFMDTIDDKGE
jgi:hypothetical protein